MATFPPKRLYIPRKDSNRQGQPEYGQDMRTIEIFNPINKLVAGSGVTLDPADGSGPQVEISASGGSSAKIGVFFVQGGQDPNEFPPGPAWGTDGLTATNLQLLLPPGASYPAAYGSDQINGGMGWQTFGQTGESVNILPELFAPDFTGAASIGVLCLLTAMSLDGNNAQQWFVPSGTPIQLTSGEVYQMLDTDFTQNYAFGADLTFTAGSGSGSGLVSSGTSPTLYLGSINFTVFFSGAVFT